jgi:hypothetical protein
MVKLPVELPVWAVEKRFEPGEVVELGVDICCTAQSYRVPAVGEENEMAVLGQTGLVTVLITGSALVPVITTRSWYTSPPT